MKTLKEQANTPSSSASASKAASKQASASKTSPSLFSPTDPLALLSHIKPLGDRVLARIDIVQSSGLLVLPPSAQYETSTASVLAVGPDAPSYLTPGCRVLPHQHRGLEVLSDGSSRYVMYKLEDLQAVFLETVTDEEIENFFSSST